MTRALATILTLQAAGSVFSVTVALIIRLLAGTFNDPFLKAWLTVFHGGILLLSLCVLLLTGCGVGGDWDHQPVVRCTNGRVLDLREWKPYVGVGGPNFLVNERTGEQITDDGKIKCYPVQR